MNNIAKFRELFNELESELRRRTTKDNWQPFITLVNNASSNNIVIKEYADILREYASLRNLIFHSKSSKYMAEPFDETIDDLSNLLEKIKNPPKLDSYLCDVLSFNSCDNLEEVMFAMKENDYSQVPIYEDSKFVQLLTSDTIFGWLAFELRSNEGIDKNAIVSDALKHNEGLTECAYIGKNRPLIEIMDLFDSDHGFDRVISAVLITENGDKNEKILGIITRSNIPSIHKKVHIKD